jgi:hypothetical protein
MAERLGDSFPTLDEVVAILRLPTPERQTQLANLDPDRFRALHIWSNPTNDIFDLFYSKREYRNCFFIRFLIENYKRLSYAAERGLEADEFLRDFWELKLFRIKNYSIKLANKDLKLSRFYELFSKVGVTLLQRVPDVLTNLVPYPQAFRILHRLAKLRRPDYQFQLSRLDNLAWCDNLDHIVEAGFSSTAMAQSKIFRIAIAKNSLMLEWLIKHEIPLPNPSHWSETELKWWMLKMLKLHPEGQELLGHYILAQPGASSLLPQRLLFNSPSLLKDALERGHTTLEQLESLQSCSEHTYTYRTIELSNKY